MSDLDIFGLYEVPIVVQTTNSTIRCPAFQDVSITMIYDFLTQFVSFISLWRVIVFLLVLGNIKNLPMIWHVSMPVYRWHRQSH